MCDLCKQRGLREAYRCPACDFDMCLRCVRSQIAVWTFLTLLYRRNNKVSAEGLLRTDKGIKEEEELSNWQYMKKASHFATRHTWLIVIAIIFLLLAASNHL